LDGPFSVERGWAATGETSIEAGVAMRGIELSFLHMSAGPMPTDDEKMLLA
jgi:hypothetical protein